MDENTIFQNKTNQSDTKPQSAPVVTSPEEAPKPQAPVVVGATPKPMWQVPTQSPDSEGGFPWGKVLKAILGVILLIVVGFVIIAFVIPFFSPKKVETVSLTYWGLWEDENTIRLVLTDFEKQNPNIKVTYTKQDIKQYKDRLVTRMQNGTGPDIFRFHNTWLPQVSTLLLPISSEVIKKEDFEKTYYGVVVNDLTRNGAIYGIPSGIDTLSLFVNTEILTNGGAQIPTNWQDFGKVARQLTVKDESGKIITSGAALGTYDNVTHASDLVSLFFVQNGADIRNIEGTAKNTADALNFYTSFAIGDAKVWDETLDPSMLAFAKGDVAMYFGYSWDIFAIKALSPQLSFQVVPVPHLPDRNMTIASYWADGISVKSKHQAESLLLLQFLSKKETVEKLFTQSSKQRLFGELYARKDLAEKLKSNVLIYPFVSQANEAVSSFFASDTYDNGLNSQMNGYLANAVRAILNNTSPESAVETLSQGVAQVLQQYEGQ